MSDTAPNRGWVCRGPPELRASWVCGGDAAPGAGLGEDADPAFSSGHPRPLCTLLTHLKGHLLQDPLQNLSRELWQKGLT